MAFCFQIWRRPVLLCWLLVAGCLSGCDQQAASSSVLRLATTTSTRDTSLLDVLLPAFEEQQACRVDVVAVGTGAALRMAEAGDADVLIVHSRQAEEAFMRQRHGIRHEEFMVNSFVLLGPESDPAGVRELTPAAALQRIAGQRQTFVSRGDDSGTHQRELQLWTQAGGLRPWDAYLEAGQGMGPTLIVADEKRGYVLSDRGTYLKFRRRIDLVPLIERGDGLRNPYAVIVVNPAKHHRMQPQLAEALVEYLLSPSAQQSIAAYRLEGEPLFRPTRMESP